MSGVLRFDQLDTTRQRVIQQNLAALKSKGASDDEIDSYLKNDEKLAPVAPTMAASDATAAQPRTSGPYLLPNLRDIAIGAVKAPINSFLNAVAAPGVGESRPDPRLSRGGNSAGVPLNQPAYDAEHGAVTSTERMHAGLQSMANTAALGLGGAGTGARLATNAAVGAAYDPDSPFTGAALGLGVGEALHSGTRLLGKAGSAVLDATGSRPLSYAGVPQLSSLARDFTNKLLSPLTDDPSFQMGERPQGPVMPDAMAGEVPTMATRRINGPDAAPQKGTLLKSTARALGVQSQEDRASQMLSNAARASGVTPEAASAVPVQSPSTALDLAQPGSPLHRLVRQAWNVPTSTAQPAMRGFFADRAAGTGDRIQGALADATGALPTDTDLPIEARLEQRAAEAKPLYQKAYQYGEIKNPETVAQIQSLLKNPTFSKAWKRGENLAELEGDTPMGQSAGPPDGISLQRWKELQEQGLDKFVPNSSQSAGPTVRQIDYWKKGLDAQIESGAGSENALSRTEARAYRQKLSGVLKRVDAEVPDYAAARQNFAGHSDLLEASEAGADHFSPKTSASYLQRSLPERFPTAGEQSEYNTNAINAFAQKVRNLAANPDLPQAARGTNLVQRLMGTADAGAKLRMLFPDDQSYQSFIGQMEQEAQYPKTQGFFANQSSTAGQLAENKTDPRLWKDLAMSPFSNHARLNLAMRALNTDTKMAPQTANLIGQQAIQTGPSMQQMVNNRFLKAAKRGSTAGTIVRSGAANTAGRNDPFR